MDSTLLVLFQENPKHPIEQKDIIFICIIASFGHGHLHDNVFFFCRGMNYFLHDVTL